MRRNVFGVVAVGVLTAAITVGCANGDKPMRLESGKNIVSGTALPDDVIAGFPTGKEFEFVRLVRTSSTHPEQPASVSGAALVRALSSLQLRRNGEEEAQRLLNNDEVERIAPVLADTLSRVQPDQEITFASTGRHGAFGPLAPDLVTTARVFVADDALQVIVGLAHESFEGELKLQNHLRPFTPGKVEARLQDGWMLRPGNSPAVSIRERGDWAVIDLDRLAAADEPEDQPTESAKTPVPAPQPVKRTPRDRLETLKALYDDGLISKEQYERKRQSIVDDL